MRCSLQGLHMQVRINPALLPALSHSPVPSILFSSSAFPSLILVFFPSYSFSIPSFPPSLSFLSYLLFNRLHFLAFPSSSSCHPLKATYINCCSLSGLSGQGQRSRPLPVVTDPYHIIRFRSATSNSEPERGNCRW